MDGRVHGHHDELKTLYKLVRKCWATFCQVFGYSCEAGDFCTKDSNKEVEKMRPSWQVDCTPPDIEEFFWGMFGNGGLKRITHWLCPDKPEKKVCVPGLSKKKPSQVDLTWLHRGFGMKCFYFCR